MAPIFADGFSSRPGLPDGLAGAIPIGDILLYRFKTEVRDILLYLQLIESMRIKSEIRYRYIPIADADVAISNRATSSAKSLPLYPVELPLYLAV